MSGGRLADLVYGLRNLRREPDLAALRAAESPEELARLAIVPAARNLGISAAFMPTHPRSEVTAAVLACRVLDAYDVLGRALRVQADRRRRLCRNRWIQMMNKVRRSFDGAIREVLNGSPPLLADPGLVARSADAGPDGPMSPWLAPLTLAFDMVQRLPDEPLTGELPVAQVRRMMFADHLAFGAVEWLRPRDADGLAALAMQFQLAAIDTAAPGSRA
jgi:hypothetical protein